MQNPFLQLREGFQSDPEESLVGSLRELCRRHDLMGCVLITFGGADVGSGVTATGFDDQFDEAMNRLGITIHRAVVDSQFDPASIEPN